MANQICIHCCISGKVQGVWFRASAKEEADKLGITGWACNLPDGRVEVFACGDSEKMSAFHAWLKHGPRLAAVTEVSYEELPWQQHQQFDVK